MRQLEGVDIKSIMFLNLETEALELDVESNNFKAWCDRYRAKELSQEELIDLYNEKAWAFPEFSKIISVSVGRVKSTGVKITTYTGDEKKILLSVNRDLRVVRKKLPGSRICGHSSKSYLIPFLFKRCIVNQVRPMDLIDVGGSKPWEVMTIDTRELWKSISFYSSSLLSTATALNCEDFIIKSPDDSVEKSECRIMTIINVFRKLTFKDVYTSYESVKGEEWKEMKMMERISYSGEITTRDKASIIELASTLSIDQKKIMIENLKGCLSYRGAKMNQETELEILGA